MSRRAYKRLRGILACVLLATARAEAQYYRAGPQEEPRWLTLRLDTIATGVFAEGYEQTTESGGSSSSQSRVFVGPLLGLGVSGSIYHPNLFDYKLNTEGSFGWTREEFNGTLRRVDNQYRYLGTFTGVAKILDNKPLNGNLFSTYNKTYQDYDFFNRVYIDQWRYGGGVRYTTGPWMFAGTGYRDTQDSTGYGIPLKSESTTGSIEGTHTRPSGSSSAAATYTSFTRNDFGFPSEGSDYTLSAADSEDFGSRKQLHSLVNLSANHLENSSVASDLYNALGNLRIDHTERLTSQYNLNYNRNEFGDAVSDNVNGDANLQHRLYESLTSQMNLRGYRYSTRSGPDRQDSWQFGGGPSFNYTKKLGASTSLSAYESLMLLHTEVESTGGVVPVFDEPHSFSAGEAGSPPGTFVLRQTRVIESTIVITDANRQPPGGFRRDLDYRVVRNGELIVIERIEGSFMPQTVLVSYNFDASPSGSYQTLLDTFGLRIDFFNHHWSVFTRLNVNRNFGGENLLLQDLNDWVVGTEGSWRFAKAGVEYEIYDSSLSPFTALRFYQSFTFTPEPNSSLSLNFTETMFSYEAPSRSEQNYTAILRYNRSLASHLGLNVELGASQRVGEHVDQTLAVFRPQLQYTAGKFTAAIGYDFGYDEYLHTETRIRNMGFIRLRKEF